MKIFELAVVGAFVALSMIGTASSALSASNPWTCVRQPNGTNFCVYVDQRGKRLCMSCRSTDTSSCSRVRCR